VKFYVSFRSDEPLERVMLDMSTDTHFWEPFVFFASETPGEAWRVYSGLRALLGDYLIPKAALKEPR